MPEHDVQFLLGQFTEAVKPIPEMAKDIAAIKGKVNALPCETHTKRIDILNGRLDQVELTDAGNNPKLALLWQILLWLIGAGTMFAAGLVFANGGGG